ncbi:MAG TPA: hypothetical protein VGI81_07210 [Tepidisphaeraceae bacterium]
MGVGFLSIAGRQGTPGGGNSGQLVVGAVNMCLILGGLAFGIIALFGIRRHGRDKILAPALVGIGLNGFFVVTSVVAIIVLAHLRATSARAGGASGGISAPPITTEQVRDSIEKSPGWAGHAQVGGASVVVLSVAGDTPLAREAREAFGTNGQPMDLVIDNATGRSDFTLDAADFSVVLKDGSTRAALAPDDLLRSAKVDNEELMAAYPWKAKVPAGSAKQAAMMLFLPADVDPVQIEHATILHDGKRVMIPGKFLSVVEKAANLARAQQNAATAPRINP